MKFFLMLRRLADYLTAITFLVMTGGVLISVFSRYIFRSPIPGAMELANNAMLWCVFIQTGFALFEDKHVNMSLLKARLRGKTLVVVEILINIIILTTSSYLLWYSVSLTSESAARGWYSTGDLSIPLFVLYGIMVIGSLFLCIIAIFKIINQIQGSKKIN